MLLFKTYLAVGKRNKQHCLESA
jgi:hypothetical protein